MQVETIYTFKNYLYIETSSFFSQNKVEKICLVSIISYPTRARGIIVNNYYWSILFQTSIQIHGEGNGYKNAFSC